MKKYNIKNIDGKKYSVYLPESLKWGKYNSLYRSGAVSFWTVIDITNPEYTEIVNNIDNIWNGDIINLKEITYILIKNISNDPGFDTETDIWQLSRLYDDYVFIEIDINYYVTSIYKPVSIENPETVSCWNINLREKITDKECEFLIKRDYKISNFAADIGWSKDKIYSLHGERGRKLWAEACNRFLKNLSYDKSLVKEDIHWELDEDTAAFIRNIRNGYSFFSIKDGKNSVTDAVERAIDQANDLGIYNRLVENFENQFK